MKSYEREVLANQIESFAKHVVSPKYRAEWFKYVNTSNIANSGIS